MTEQEYLIDCLALTIAEMSKERRDKFLVLFRKKQGEEVVERVLTLARQKWRQRREDEKE